MVTATEQLKVLLVEDDEDDYLITRDMLAGQGRVRFCVEWCVEYEDALAAIREQRHDVYLIDYRLGERTGLELVRDGFASRSRAAVLILTGQSDYEIDLEATSLGVTDYLVKQELAPLSLERSIRYAVRAERMTSDLEQQRTRLIEAQSIAQLGSWEWDVATDAIEWSDELCRIYGLGVGGNPASFEQYIGAVHPDDRDRVAATIQAAFAACQGFAFKHRIVRPDGVVRVLQSLGEVVAGDDGQPVRMLGTAQDITDRELMESQLRHNGRYFELSRDLTVTSSFDGYFKSVNPAVTQILGWSADEFLARPFIDMVHPDDRSATLAEVEKLAEGHTTFSFVNRYEAKDGSYRWLDWNAIVAPDDELMYASARDVTERNLAQAALAAGERRTRQILETANDAFIAIDARGAIIDWNPTAETLFGWPRDEALGRELADTIIPQGHRDAHRRGLERFLSSGEAAVMGKSLELSALHRDGREFPIELTISPLETEDGYTFNAFLRDISERRQAQDERQRDRRLLADLLDSAPDGVVIADAHGQITLVNEQAERLFGYDRAELIGAPIEKLLPQSVHQRHVAHRARYLDAPGTRPMGFGLDLAGRRKDGTEFPVDISLSTTSTREGTLATAFVRDITERKRTQDELTVVHEKALEASRLKSEFVANMSHEIRTPLNGVIGMSGLLLDTELSAEQREYAEAVRTSGDALMTVIEDILYFSKIEAGKLELDNDAFDVRELVEDASAMLAATANEKNLELITWIDDGVADVMSGDGPRVRQVLVNLLTNAVKFTPAGNVVVHVSEQPGSSGRSRLRFEVSDTGIGIDGSALDRIFESFSQADNSTTRRYGGTGLGLAISKRLVDLMAGEIGVESELGQGSRFWFEVTVDVMQTRKAPRVPASVAHVRTLVVDDNAINRTILERLLVSWGMDCVTAADAHVALSILREAARSERPYQLVMLDSRMPQMSGIELATEIRADAALRSVTLLMLSSSGSRRAIAAEAGIDGFVTKPVRQSRLRDEVTRVLGIPEPLPTVVANGSSQNALGVSAASRRAVLVAEDNTVNQLVASRLLEKRGFRVDVATNGRVALDMHERSHYEAIFMDCQMPEVDGYEATAEIRRREGSDRHTPIIAMTASTMNGDRERCLAAGMDDYLGKPLRAVRLDEVLRRVH